MSRFIEWAGPGTVEALAVVAIVLFWFAVAVGIVSILGRILWWILTLFGVE